jgi:hypothetical protein
MSDWREKLANLIKSVPVKQKVFIGIFIVAGIISLLYSSKWSGFGEDSNKTVTIKDVINPLDGKIIKLTEKTEIFQSGKTFWDWLNLASTLAIPIVLFQFESREQKRASQRAQEEKESAEKQAEVEKAIADNSLREEALQSYIDRMSQLLLDKNLKNLDLENPLRDIALDVARARTLSVLRTLDGKRKGSLIEFLIDLELIGELNLSEVYLYEADLKRVNLSGVNLRGADLRGADLRDANLKGADLSFTNLRGANLKGINLNDANLQSATLSNAVNINPDIIKSAQNWEKAEYDDDFRAMLGLSPENA